MDTPQAGTLIKFLKEGEKHTRLDILVFGDLLPEGVERKPGEVHAGPYAHSSVVLEGDWPDGKIPQKFIDDVAKEFRYAVEHHARKMLIRRTP